MDVWIMERDGDPRPLIVTPASELNMKFSPDRRWAISSQTKADDSRSTVQAFPTPLDKWQVSVGGGTFPRWRPDGKEVFYLAPGNRLMATSVIVATNGQSIEPGTPVSLFTPRFATGGAILTPAALGVHSMS